MDRNGSACVEPARRDAGRWRRTLRPAVLLVLGGVSLYLLLPSLLAVFGAWRSLSHLDWPFGILALACEVASWVCLWEVDRVALHTRAWFPVAAAQLTGTAVSRILPGGGATATATAATMLRRAGVAEPDEAVAAFGVAAVLQMATTFALPVLVLPAILGGTAVNHSLKAAAYLGIAVLGALIVVGVVTFTSDAPLDLTGRALQRLLNTTVRRRRPVTGLPHRLLRDRDLIQQAVGARWKTVVCAAAGNTVFDYFALLAALCAVGADPHPSLVLLAYTAGELLAMLPFTPGGLGFVEAGLVGTLTLAGVPGTHALAATLLYRIVSYWLPLPAGALAYLLFRHRYDAAKADA